MGASASVDRPQLKLAADTAREGDVDSQLAALMIRTGWLGMGAGTVPSGTLGPSGKEDPYMSKQLPAPVRRELGVPQRYSRAEAIACTSRWLIKTAKKVAEDFYGIYINAYSVLNGSSINLRVSKLPYSGLLHCTQESLRKDS